MHVDAGVDLQIVIVVVVGRRVIICVVNMSHGVLMIVIGMMKVHMAAVKYHVVVIGRHVHVQRAEGHQDETDAQQHQQGHDGRMAHERASVLESHAKSRRAQACTGYVH